MIQNQEGEMDYLTFPLFEQSGMVEHLFSTRLGGVSKGIFESMNVSFTRGDDADAVTENYRRIAKVLHSDLNHFVCSQQTHTTNVRVVTAEDAGKGVVQEMDYKDVDGLVTNVPGLILATFYADCVPLFVLDPVHRAIGLSHSGWRGTVNRMGKKTIQVMMEQYGTTAKDVIVGIGPSICLDCYEVSEDVADAFRKEFGSCFETDYRNPSEYNKLEQNKIIYNKGKGKYQLDLWRANKQVFLDAGVPETQIQITDICTSCNPQYLFSHRKTNGKRGNLGAFMCLREKE